MRALDRLGILLNLQRRARNAPVEELPFVMVNETRQLLPYRQAALFTMRMGRATLAALSGLAVPDRNAPYAQWLAKYVAWRLTFPDAGKLRTFDLAAPAEEIANAPVWLAEWAEWLPRHCLWAPLPDGRGGLVGVLLLAREEGFSEADAMMVSHVTESYGQTLSLSRSRPARGMVPRSLFSPVFVVLLCCLAAAGFYPVRQTVLAPAEVAARRPALVRSGLEGVIDRFLVEPNQRVEEGQPLIRLEDAQLRTRLAVAKKAEDMARAEYRQLLQAALSDPKTKQRIPLIQGRIEQLAAESAYIESLIERTTIPSPMRGVILCDNPDEWLGRPVSLGQRIMLVADPERVQLEIALPAKDAMTVAVGDTVLFYPNVSPDAPREAAVTFVGYRAGEVPGLGLAYIVRAEMTGDDQPLLGLRGMVKLYGPKQPLFLTVFRTPIMAARQWLGL